MPWEMNERDELDIPSLPFSKPKEFETLENLSRSQRDAMDPIELEEHTQRVANSLAVKYKKEIKGDYQECRLIIESAMKELGSSFGGKSGATIVGLSSKVAKKAATVAYPNQNYDY